MRIVSLILLLSVSVAMIYAEAQEEAVPLLLEVEGRISMDSGEVILETESGRRYLLTGELPEITEGTRMRALGRPSVPGEEVKEALNLRFIIDIIETEKK